MKPLPQLPSHPANRIAALTVLPVFFTLEGKRAVVIGGTAAAAWKAELLAAAGANVHIYAATPGEEMLTLVSNGAAAGTMLLIPANWTPPPLADAALIVADTATEDEARRLRKAAREAGVPINIIDQPEFCDFQFGSIVNRSPVVVGISTGGAAPVLAQAVRSRIESIIPTHLAGWAKIAQRIRHEVSARFPRQRERRRFWEAFAARAMQAPPDDAEAMAAESAPGCLTTIAATCADDLTLREIRALQSADAVHIHGRCPEGVLDFARREAKRIIHRAGDRIVPRGIAGNIVVIRS
jgi:uroporphyrin-III C-methyltransferase / precorrin-2 dehydrogenase / sirohydrochlorin ferrochelatase